MVRNGILLALALISSQATAYSIERAEKLTIVKFAPSDFQTSYIEEDLGWRLGCLLETQTFDLPDSFDSEVEIILDVSAAWEHTFKNADALATHRLATLELSYVDRFGASMFEPKMLRPAHFGATNLFAETPDRRLSMYGGSSDEKKRVVHGPLIIRSGAKKILIGLCEIAPTTTFRVHELQVRFRPVN